MRFGGICLMVGIAAAGGYAVRDVMARHDSLKDLAHWDKRVERLVLERSNAEAGMMEALDAACSAYGDVAYWGLELWNVEHYLKNEADAKVVIGATMQARKDEDKYCAKARVARNEKIRSDVLEGGERPN